MNGRVVAIVLQLVVMLRKACWQKHDVLGQDHAKSCWWRASSTEAVHRIALDRRQQHVASSAPLQGMQDGVGVQSAHLHFHVVHVQEECNQRSKRYASMKMQHGGSAVAPDGCGRFTAR